MNNQPSFNPSFNPELNKKNTQQQMYGQQQVQMGQQVQYGQNVQMGNQMGQQMQYGQKQMQYGTGQKQMQYGQKQMQYGQQQQMQYGQQQQQMQYGQQQQYGQKINMGMGMQQQFTPLVDPLMTYFKTVDTDSSGYIDPKELKVALLKTPKKLNVSIECCRMLTKMFQVQQKMSRHKNTLSFVEFKNCYSYLVQVQNFFHQVDVDKSGFLTSNEMFNACKKSGYQIDYKTFGKLFKMFDKQGKKKLMVAEYLEICVFLATILGHFQKALMSGGKKGKSKGYSSVSKAPFSFSMLVALATSVKYGL